MWDIQALSQAPKTHAAPAPGYSAEGVQALFFDSVPWKGKPTRVFAWVGMPRETAGEKAPGMVLIHGGGGTAFANWVQLWNARGYAAIAMDTCGCTGGGEYSKRPRHEAGGPPGWGGCDQMEWPLHDQWSYHAAAAVILSHSLLRSYPQVDAERIGVTGNSWGGYLTSLAASVDARFAFAAPLFGCGFLAESSCFAPALNALPADQKRAWIEHWDLSSRLHRLHAPAIWINGTNDFAFPLDSWQKSYRLTPNRTVVCTLRMNHADGDTVNPLETFVAAESILKRSAPALATISKQGIESQKVWATYASEVPIVKAELLFTRQRVSWVERLWETIPAELDTSARRATSKIPAGTSVCFLNLIDARGATVSTEHVELS
jgi:dienelactone hydrolase